MNLDLPPKFPHPGSDLDHRFLDRIDLGLPAFPQERGDPLGQPQLPVDFPEKKQPG